VGESDPERPVVARMAGSLESYWRSARPYQRFLYEVAALFLASTVVHAMAFLVDDRPWEGAVSWRKPLLFSLSFGLVCVSVAWVMTFLPRRPVVGWSLAGLFAVASVGEVALIAMQAWGGTHSHFNSESLFDELVFAAMGILIILAAAVIVVLTTWAGGSSCSRGGTSAVASGWCSWPRPGTRGSWERASGRPLRAGRAPLDLSGTTGLLIVAGALAVVAAYALALARLGAFRPQASPSAG
jgi:hypothetical protein